MVAVLSHDKAIQNLNPLQCLILRWIQNSGIRISDHHCFGLPSCTISTCRSSFAWTFTTCVAGPVSISAIKKLCKNFLENFELTKIKFFYFFVKSNKMVLLVSSTCEGLFVLMVIIDGLCKSRCWWMIYEYAPELISSLSKCK